MAPARTTLVYGVVLVALGLSAYGLAELLKDDGAHRTSLIPAACGALLVIAGVIGLLPRARMHAMHAAALLALLTAIGGLSTGVPGLFKLFGGELSSDRRWAVPVQLLMGLIPLGLLFQLGKSFVAARRDRKKAESDDAAQPGAA